MRWVPGVAECIAGATILFPGIALCAPSDTLADISTVTTLADIIVTAQKREENLQTTPVWVGWHNYRQLASDPVFLESVRHTLVYTVFFVPITLVLTWPVMQMRGTESIFASARQVTKFVAPGPLVAMQTPGLPVVRAYPSAMKPPPCSWRGRMVRSSFEYLVSDWCSGMLAPPG